MVTPRCYSSVKKSDVWKLYKYQKAFILEQDEGLTVLPDCKRSVYSQSEHVAVKILKLKV